MENKAAANTSAPILAIESSCDETACAILDADGTVRAELVASQIAEHARFGGVVPEIAARAHLAVLAGPSGLAASGLATRALAMAGLRAAELGAIAATTGPGLIGGLIVGSNFAKAMALALDRPFYAINHLEAHALTARLPGLAPNPPEFPYLCLLVSGGHSLLLEVQAVGRYRRLGSTIDDAAGEAFDKVAKLLGLDYPGGPALERLAAEGDPTAIALPRPLRGRAGCDFSFSGLKTAVAQKLAQLAGEHAPDAALPHRLAADCAASFQRAMVDIFVDRLDHALRMTNVATVVVAGGVAANGAIRSALETVAQAHGARLIAPPLRLCTDNAVMVAWAAHERRRAGFTPDPLDAPCRPRWPIGTVQ